MYSIVSKFNVDGKLFKKERFANGDVTIVIILRPGSPLSHTREWQRANRSGGKESCEEAPIRLSRLAASLPERDAPALMLQCAPVL